MDTDNKYGVLDFQKGLLSLMKSFDSFCVENNIQYSVDSGTLLGVIRHDGFIPWDDDLDVVMDRSNYAKFVDLIKFSETLCTFTDMWMTRVQFKKKDSSIIPTLDIFIMDNAPDNVFFRKYRIFQIAFLQSLFKGKPSVCSPLVYLRLFIGYIIGLPFSYQTKMKWYDRISQKSNSKNTRYKSCYNYLYQDLHAKFPSSIMESIVRHKFESIEVSVVKDYDTYLTELYGKDYLIPPKEARAPIHMVEREVRHF